MKLRKRNKLIRQVGNEERRSFTSTKQKRTLRFLGKVNETRNGDSERSHNQARRMLGRYLRRAWLGELKWKNSGQRALSRGPLHRSQCPSNRPRRQRWGSRLGDPSTVAWERKSNSISLILLEELIVSSRQHILCQTPCREQIQKVNCKIHI